MITRALALLMRVEIELVYLRLADFLVMHKPDLKLLQDVTALLQRQLRKMSTSVPELMQQALDSKAVSLEGLYYAAIDLRNHFGNVLTAVTGLHVILSTIRPSIAMFLLFSFMYPSDEISDTRNFRQIDTSSPVYMVGVTVCWCDAVPCG
mgnify:CR=1 FL=1